MNNNNALNNFNNINLIGNSNVNNNINITMKNVGPIGKTVVFQRIEKIIRIK